MAALTATNFAAETLADPEPTFTFAAQPAMPVAQRAFADAQHLSIIAKEADTKPTASKKEKKSKKPYRYAGFLDALLAAA